MEYGGGVHRIRLCVLGYSPSYRKSLSCFCSRYFRYQVCGVWDWSCRQGVLCCTAGGVVYARFYHIRVSELAGEEGLYYPVRVAYYRGGLGLISHKW